MVATPPTEYAQRTRYPAYPASQSVLGSRSVHHVTPRMSVNRLTLLTHVGSTPIVMRVLWNFEPVANAFVIGRRVVTAAPFTPTSSCHSIVPSAAVSR